MDRQALRDLIIAALLPHVPFDGWTRKALDAAVADAGFPPDMALRAFPEGMGQVVTHFSGYADRAMVDELEKRWNEVPRTRDRLTLAVRLRLEFLAPHRETVRRALAFVALPLNAGIGARCAYRTVDAIWRAAGDRAVDFSFYTKRGLLAAVYSATVLYWLTDTSDDFADTWDFLDRRIGDVMKLPGLRRRIEQAVAGLGPRRRAYPSGRRPRG